MDAAPETLDLGMDAPAAFHAAHGYAAFYEDEWATLYCADGTNPRGLNDRKGK